MKSLYNQASLFVLMNLAVVSAACAQNDNESGHDGFVETMGVLHDIDDFRFHTKHPLFDNVEGRAHEYLQSVVDEFLACVDGHYRLDTADPKNPDKISKQEFFNAQGKSVGVVGYDKKGDLERIGFDNYDSFVHNLARYVEQAGHETKILRNDEINVDEIKALHPEAIIISPGPKTPKDAGICIELVKKLGSTIPILGVCLGHQVIGEAMDGITIRHEPTHGKSTKIHHNRHDLFEGLPNPLTVGRYHSLIIQTPHPELEITAVDEQDTPMAIQHTIFPLFGVQFHPESILTPEGLQIIQNFSDIVKQWNKEKAA